MRLHNAGKYNGDESSLPQREHPEGYVPFKEPENMKKFALYMNFLAIAILIVTLGLFYLRLFKYSFANGGTSFVFTKGFIGGFVLYLATLVPHEFLHAIWFKEDVYYHHNLKQGMLFVVGTEDMPKWRFVAMSMCPNVIFGFIPYILFMIRPDLAVLGYWGAMAIASGAGDYTNVFNCITQVPKGGITYMSGMHSYWYMPKEDKCS